MWNSVKAAIGLPKKVMLATAGTVILSVPILIGLASPPVLAQTAARTTADPRSEAALRGQIEGFEKHQPAFAVLASGQPTGQYYMADFIRRNQAAYEQKFDALGALKSITFKGVEYDTDYYIVEFANGRVTAGIALTPEGKVGNLEFIERSNPNGPEPGTEAALRQIINGLADGPPFPTNVLSPELAREMRVSGGWLSEVMPAVIVLGPLKSLTFQDVTMDGRDQYEATYEHGRVSWTASPLIGGKIVNFEVRISSPENPKKVMDLNSGAEYY